MKRESRCAAAVGNRLGGDDSVLVRYTSSCGRQPGSQWPAVRKDQYIAVVRTGKVLVIVADTGWECGSGHESVLRLIVPAAIRRAAALS